MLLYTTDCCITLEGHLVGVIASVCRNAEQALGFACFNLLSVTRTLQAFSCMLDRTPSVDLLLHFATSWVCGSSASSVTVGCNFLDCSLDLVPYLSSKLSFWQGDMHSHQGMCPMVSPPRGGGGGMREQQALPVRSVVLL